MENLWLKSHEEILKMKVGDFYHSGGDVVSVIRRTPKRIYFSNGSMVSIQKSKYGDFFFLNGKNVNQILRDIEGYFLFLKHDPLLLK